MLKLSLKELKQIEKITYIKGCTDMSKERLLSVLRKSESANSKKNLDNAKKKKIWEDFNKLTDRILKPKMNEIKKSVYEIESKKNLSESKIKKIEKSLFELE